MSDEEKYGNAEDPSRDEDAAETDKRFEEKSYTETDAPPEADPDYDGETTAAPKQLTIDDILDLDQGPPPDPFMLPPTLRDRLSDPTTYRPDPGLMDAVRVALSLRQPLLLTGEPGTGKTRLANFLAHRLNYGKALEYRVKSNSISSELFYSYDAIGRFNERSGGPGEGQGKGKDDPLKFIRFNALGKAILFANPEKYVKSYCTYLHEDDRHPGEPRGSVVLIDEVDKAPRDFPNDILAEIDEMSFSVKEVDDRKISADSARKPVVVVTSNSEKDLPDAFLRRCIYYHINFPVQQELERIVFGHIANVFAPPSEGNESKEDSFTTEFYRNLSEKKPSDYYVSGLIDFFYKILEEKSRFQRQPGTSELLEWILAVVSVQDKQTVFDPKNLDLSITIPTLFKTKHDKDQGQEILEGLIKNTSTTGS